MNIFEKLSPNFKDLYKAQLSEDGQSTILTLLSTNGVIAISHDCEMEESEHAYSFRKLGKYWLHVMKNFNNVNVNLF